MKKQHLCNTGKKRGFLEARWWLPHLTWPDYLWCHRFPPSMHVNHEVLFLLLWLCQLPESKLHSSRQPGNVNLTTVAPASIDACCQRLPGSKDQCLFRQIYSPILCCQTCNTLQLCRIDQHVNPLYCYWLFENMRMFSHNFDTSEWWLPCCCYIMVCHLNNNSFV